MNKSIQYLPNATSELKGIHKSYHPDLASIQYLPADEISRDLELKLQILNKIVDILDKME